MSVLNELIRLGLAPLTKDVVEHGITTTKEPNMTKSTLQQQLVVLQRRVEETEAELERQRSSTPVPQAADASSETVKLTAELVAAGNITMAQAQTGLVRTLIEQRGVKFAREVLSKSCVLEPQAAFEHLQHLTEQIATTEKMARYEASFRAFERYPALARQAGRLSSTTTELRQHAPGTDEETPEWQAANKAANDAYLKLRGMAEARIEQKMRDCPDIYRTRNAAYASAMEDVHREHPELAQKAMGRERWAST
ncbi:MAG: hypothetical protein IPJ65_07280 [Archangiaceae bacterium]|nr:hypothetical protein [Archangiaceae bacterium]